MQLYCSTYYPEALGAQCPHGLAMRSDFVFRRARQLRREPPASWSGEVRMPVTLGILGSAGSGPLTVHGETCLLVLVLGYSGHWGLGVETDRPWGEGSHSRQGSFTRLTFEKENVLLKGPCLWAHCGMAILRALRMEPRLDGLGLGCIVHGGRWVRSLRACILPFNSVLSQS